MGSLDSGHSPVDTPAASLSGKMVDASIMTAESVGDGPFYWWRTSGQDLSRMLIEADYPDECRRKFLEFYRDTICPLLGGRPEPSSLPAAVGWDGNPFEYSFEFKGSTKHKVGVRFVLDLSELRPAKKDRPLDVTTVERVLDVLRERSPMYDEKWHRDFERWFVYANASPERQKDLVNRVGIQTPTILGFDINPKILEKAPGMLPVMVKSYFPPDFAAVDRNLTRFQSLSLGIRQIPDIASFPNLLHGLRMIEEYVDDHPQYHSCGRGMACDLVPAGIGRLKVYLRYWGRSFDEIWDYYTLGGRIPGLDDDRDKLREMVELAHGRDYPASKRRPEAWAERRRRHMFATKPTSLYFSLTPDTPYPVPKLYFYPAQTAPNDEAIAQGIDAWMAKYGWQDGGKTLEERVRNVFSHRRLDEKPGIFTFIGIGRKEGSTDLSVQAYVTPELYETPRY